MDLRDILKSAMLFSSDYAAFTERNQLLALRRAHPPASIPEDGTLALVSGFNRWPDITTIPALAARHLLDRFGLDLPELPQEEFTGTLYPASVQQKPVKIPLPDGTPHLFYGPRQAFTAKLVLSDAQVAAIRLNPKFFTEVVQLDLAGFDAALTEGDISFPYQAELVRSYFA